MTASMKDYEPKKAFETFVSPRGASPEEKEIILDLLLEHLGLAVVEERGYGQPVYRLTKSLP